METIDPVPSPVAPPPVPVDAPAASRRTILHLSDLHFGYRFDRKGKWASVRNEACSIRPDLVIITGDLLNTPWRWMWPRVRRSIEAFRTELREATNNPELDVCVIPGNHDTRISGVFPVPWLLGTAAAFAVACALFLLLFSVVPRVHWVATTVAVAAALLAIGCALMCATGIVLRALVKSDLRAALGDELWLDRARLFPALRLGVVPFDSASSKLMWARGHVPPDSLHAAKIDVQREEATHNPQGRASVWLAAVHHHPLPLPYDSDNETMMVMDNAGAFLRELARCGVKLVLHGHKHHQHFARIAVDPATEQRLQIAVLSAGTPTEGRRAGEFRHGFNVIHVDADDRLSVQMYEAAPNGGTFVAGDPFDVVPSEDHARDQFEHQCVRGGLWCRRMVCIADINEYGDARFVREFRGVETSREAVTALPSTLVAGASSGSVEGFRALSLSTHGPGVTVRVESKTRDRVEARVVFKGSGLQRGDDPIDFMTDVQANNAFALNRWQFESMYRSRSDYMESVGFRSPAGIAVEELVVHVRFPAGSGLPHRLDVRRGAGGENAEQWEAFGPRTLVRLESQNAAELRIMHPVPGAVYQIDWDLEELAPTPADQAVEHAVTRGLALRGWLAGLIGNPAPAELVAVLEDAEGFVRDKLIREEGTARPLEFVLYGYVERLRRLLPVHCNYRVGDQRRTWTFPFGLGLPGRAFKSAEMAVFTRPHDWESGRPLGYLQGDDLAPPPVRRVPEASLLAIPLAPPEAPDWPYAVLQIGTDDVGVRLHVADTPTDNALEEVTAALQENLLISFVSIMDEALQQQ